MSYLAIILAAGKSTRMGNLKKVFCKVGDEAIIIHLIQTVLSSNPNHIIIVINSDYTEEEKKHISDFIGVKSKYTFAYQNNPKGTGEAVKIALEGLEDSTEDFKEDFKEVIVFYGDTPLIGSGSIKIILTVLPVSKVGVICGFCSQDNNQYGRIVLNKSNQIEKIVEYKDSNYNVETPTCNAGIMAVKFDFLKDSLKKIDADNEAKEYYLFDILKFSKEKFNYLELEPEEALGINNFIELENAEFIWQNRQRNYWLQNFIQLVDKDSVYFGFNNKIGKFTKIHPGVILGKNVEIGERVEIGAYSVIGENVRIGSNTIVKPFSYIQSSTIGDDCEIGPFSSINGKNDIGNKNIIGNFVEIKRSRLGNNNKAKHLAYIGDGLIENDNNFGAGSIFCNYDGKDKHSTTIGNKNMVGANVSLIAPLTIGDENTIGAGSVVYENVNDGNLVLERGEQKTRKRKI